MGSSGILLSSVIRKKKGENKNFIIVDAGMNNLIRPAMYDAKHEIFPVKKIIQRKIDTSLLAQFVNPQTYS